MTALPLFKAAARIFPQLPGAGISAARVVIAVLAARLLLRKAPRFRCILWGIVGLRLVCPIRIKSVFSLMPPAQTIRTGAPAAQGVQQAASMVIDVMKHPAYQQRVTPGLDAAASEGADALSAMSAVWVIGVLAMLLYAAVCEIIIRRRVSDSVPYDRGVRLTDRIGTPFLLGIFKKTIYLPFSVAAEDVKYVIAHERAHIKRGDYLWKPLGFALLAVYWFNPAVWVSYFLLCRDIESACDERVISRMEPEDVRGYSLALLNCSAGKGIISVSPLAFGEQGVKERIENIMSYKKPKALAVFAAAALCIACAVCFLTDPIEAKSEEQTEISSKQQEVLNEARIDEDPAEVGERQLQAEELSEASPGEASEQEPSNDAAMLWPCDNTRLTQGFGGRVHPVSGETTEHRHIDIAGEKGDPVYAALPGEVVRTEYEAARGYYIVIKHSEELSTEYRHLSEMSVAAGDAVAAGDQIAQIGATGLATGPHLAFCVIENGEYVDPLAYVDIDPAL